VSAAGNAYCWGQNREGRLGDGTKVTRSAPIRVASDHRFFELSAGRQFTCGRTDRGAHCWGSNRSGQLGSADKHDAVVPVPVIRGQGLASVSAYAIHACAVALELGIAYCWGADWSGQLGNGDDDWHLGPHPVAGGLRFRTLAAGWLFACGITTDDVIWCWGGNDAGQLGSADDGDDCQFLSGQPLPCATTPTAMPAARTYSSITAGSIHACALTPAGRAYCWGRNAEGQLGNGTTTGTSSPVPVAGTLAFVALTAGDHHTCGLTTDGTAYCWGDNRDGALGTGATFDNCGGRPCSATPVQVDSDLRFEQLSASRGDGGAHTCGITTGERLYCWGQNSWGQLGAGFRGGISFAPLRVSGQP
jgi:alpha-tubulin suppressor-like RCC1 family protein